MTDKALDDKPDIPADGPAPADNAGAAPALVPAPAHVGAKLRASREAAGLTLDDIAARTRVTMRHLQSIEAGRLADLPGKTYVIGFVRGYARALGLDEVSLVEQTRHEIGAVGPRTAREPDFSPADPRRVPPRALVWTAAVLLLLLVGGYVIIRSLGTGGPDAPTAEDYAAVSNGIAPPSASAGAAGGAAAPLPMNGSGPANAPASAPAPTASGDVVLTATAPVWVRVYDSNRTRLFEKEMAAGERYVVPAEANGPMILTGKPDSIAVTVGGQPVPPLGTGERTIADVGISAAALAARAAALTPPSAARGQSPLPPMPPAN